MSRGQDQVVPLIVRSDLLQQVQVQEHCKVTMLAHEPVRASLGGIAEYLAYPICDFSRQSPEQLQGEVPLNLDAP